MHIYIYERWKKRPDQKGKQSIPSAGNQHLVPAGSVSATKKRILAKTRLPANGFSIWPMENVQGDMPDTIRGSKNPESAQNGPIYPDVFFDLTVFPTPHI